MASKVAERARDCLEAQPGRQQRRKSYVSVLFLCCTESGRQFTVELYDALRGRSIDTFYDRESTLWGDSIKNTTEEALKRCSHGLVVVTPDFLTSNERSAEQRTVARALFERAQKGSMVFLPVLLEVSKEDFKEALPFLSSRKSLLVPSKASTDIQTLAGIIEKRLNDNPKGANRRQPAPATSESKPGGLPCRTPHFKGRDADVNKILRNIGSPLIHLCSISGPPGIGKSSLAIEVAHRVRDKDFCYGAAGERYNWKVAFLNAKNLESETQFAAELLRMLKIYFPLPQDHLPSLSDILSADRSRSITSELMDTIGMMHFPCIILDNCDRALQEDNRSVFFQFLQELLQAMESNYMLMITSCFSVASLLPGVSVLDVCLNPLGKVDAGDLLKTICTSMSGNLKDETIASVGSICMGFPISIQLAGAVFRKCQGAVTQEEILSKLKKGPLRMFEEVVDKTALKFVATFYNLLSRRLQLFLHGLALFTGSFSRSEGARVFNLTDGVQFGMHVVSSLNEYSLLIKVSEEVDSGDKLRYCLHDLIRDFLREKEKDYKGDLAAFKKIQQRYCLMQLQRITRLQKAYDEDPQNVIQTIQGYQAVIEQLADLIKPATENPKVWGQYLFFVGNRNSMLKSCFRPALRKKLLKACLGVALNKGDSGVLSVAKIRIILCEVLLSLNELKRASSCLDKVRQHIGTWPVIRARYWQQLARCHVAKGDGETAVKILEKELVSLPAAAKERPEYFVALGDAYQTTRRYQTAVDNYSKALKWCSERLGQPGRPETPVDLHPDTCDLLMWTGHCYFCAGFYTESLESFSKALTMQFCLASDRCSVALTHYQMGISLAALGSRSEAVDNFCKVHSLLEAPGLPSHPLCLLARQAQTKLLFAQLIESAYSGNERETRQLNEVADSFQNLTENVCSMDSNEMGVVLAENYAYLTVIYGLLLNPTKASDNKRSLMLLNLNRIAIDCCCMISSVLNANFEEGEQKLATRAWKIASRNRILYYSYVGRRLTAEDESNDHESRSRSLSQLSQNSSTEEFADLPQPTKLADARQSTDEWDDWLGLQSPSPIEYGLTSDSASELERFSSVDLEGSPLGTTQSSHSSAVDLADLQRDQRSCEKVVTFYDRPGSTSDEAGSSLDSAGLEGHRRHTSKASDVVKVYAKETCKGSDKKAVEF